MIDCSQPIAWRLSPRRVWHAFPTDRHGWSECGARQTDECAAITTVHRYLGNLPPSDGSAGERVCLGCRCEMARRAAGAA